MGLANALQAVRLAVEGALHSIQEYGTATLPVSNLFVAASVGMAGLDKPNDIALIREHLQSLLAIEESENLIIGNDASLLSLAMLKDGYEHAVTLVAGEPPLQTLIREILKFARHWQCCLFLRAR